MTILFPEEMTGTEKAVPETEELPKAIVRRVVKNELSRCSDDGDTSVYKDAILAFSESARIFIHHLSSRAKGICKRSKRQILSADDVYKALEETEFSAFVPPIKASLEEFMRKNAEKKRGTPNAKDRERKRKLEGVIQWGRDIDV